MTAKEQRSKAGSWKRTDDHPPVGSPIELAHYVKEMNSAEWSNAPHVAHLDGVADTATLFLLSAVIYSPHRKRWPEASPDLTSIYNPCIPTPWRPFGCWL
jgi:hypothetical protein